MGKAMEYAGSPTSREVAGGQWLAKEATSYCRFYLGVEGKCCCAKSSYRAGRTLKVLYATSLLTLCSPADRYQYGDTKELSLSSAARSE